MPAGTVITVTLGELIGDGLAEVVGAPGAPGAPGALDVTGVGEDPPLPPHATSITAPRKKAATKVPLGRTADKRVRTCTANCERILPQANAQLPEEVESKGLLFS